MALAFFRYCTIGRGRRTEWSDSRLTWPQNMGGEAITYHTILDEIGKEGIGVSPDTREGGTEDPEG